jgi:hypothetical protein
MTGAIAWLAIADLCRTKPDPLRYTRSTSTAMPSPPLTQSVAIP